jgi:hypothetical protein
MLASHAEILQLMSKNKVADVSLPELEFGRNMSLTLTYLFGMVPERSNSSSYRERAAISAWCAEQTASAEAAAALLYLEQMWILVADVAEIIEENRSRAALGSDPHYLPRE